MYISDYTINLLDIFQSCLLLSTGAPSFPLGGDLPEGNNLSDLMRAVDPNFLENLNLPSGSSSQFKVITLLIFVGKMQVKFR
jgi:hypothetical protein